MVLIGWVKEKFKDGKKRWYPEEQVCPTKLERGARLRRALKTTPHRACYKAIIREGRRISGSGVAEMLDIGQIETCNSQLLSKTVLLHHDSAFPNSVAATIQTIRNLKFEVQPKPSYSTDLEPCVCHALGPLKEAWLGRQFGNDEEVKKAVHTWFREQSKPSFSDGIRKLVDRYKKCVELLGDYVEK